VVNDLEGGAYVAGQGSRLLIAEDELVLAELLRDLLEPEGYQVDHLAQESEILERLQQHAVDLLLLDLNLLGKNGLEICRSVREQEQQTRLHLPILVLTGDHRDQTRQEVLLAGADGVHLKPFDLNLLLSEIATLLLQPSCLEPETETAETALLPL
jgi:DNA-binding response OmpR family regulator